MMMKMKRFTLMMSMNPKKNKRKKVKKKKVIKRPKMKKKYRMSPHQYPKLTQASTNP